MATKAKHHIPAGYHSVTPYLVVKGAAQALEFYQHVLKATLLFQMPMSDGTIGHAEMRIGDSLMMLAEESAERNSKGPKSHGGTGVGFTVYFENCDAVFNAAIKAGATVERPLADQFYGDRSGTFLDPFGHKWTVATHQEDVSPVEMQARMAKLGKG